MNIRFKFSARKLKHYVLLVCTVFALLVCQYSSAQTAKSLEGKTLERKGRHFISLVYKNNQFSEDLQLITYINALSEKLAKAAKMDYEAMRYYVLADSRINAFAAPGASFFVNTGTISLVRHEGELASVIAHELAHHKQKHLTRLLEDSKAANLTSLLSFLVGISVGGEEGLALATAGHAAGVESIIDYTLAYEREADAVGLRILLAANYHPMHAVEFMKALEKSIRERGLRQTNIHNTHPVTQERIASFEARVNRYKQHAKDHSSIDFHFAKARNHVLYDWHPLRSEIIIKDKISKSQGIEKVANQYGYALALLKQNKLDAARSQFRELIQQNPGNRWLLLAAAETEINHGNASQAVQMLSSLASASNIDPALVEMYSLALLNSGQNEEAYRFIRKHIRNFSKYGTLHRLQARIAHLNGDMFNSYISQANYYFQLGHLEVALKQLKTAEGHAVDTYDAEIARAKQQIVQNELVWRTLQL